MNALSTVTQGKCDHMCSPDMSHDTCATDSLLLLRSFVSGSESPSGLNMPSHKYLYDVKHACLHAGSLSSAQPEQLHR